MEGFILFIIIAVVSTILGRSKEEKKDTKQMPPFLKDAKPKHTEANRKKDRPTIQSFEDFAKEFMGELKDTIEQQKPELKPIFSKSVEQPKAPMNEPAPVVERQQRSKEKLQQEEPLQERSPLPQKEQASISAIPSSKQALVQAFVMAEVLGPPKAKQIRK